LFTLQSKLTTFTGVAVYLKYSPLIVFYLVCCFFLLGCEKPKRNGAVRIVFRDGKYMLYRNGKPFMIKGASGNTNLKDLAEAGGNTIRVWDTTNLKSILDSAQSHHLAVVVGLPMPDNSFSNDFYDNGTAVNRHYKKVAMVVNRYKHHPALLCWCLGNELAFPYKPKYNTFYQSFNKIVDMIHHDDPDHPVTTTIMTFQKKNIINITLRTHIDFISFNIFGAIHTLRKDLENFAWFWKGPFLITEWGIEGPWNKEEENAWGAYVENSSLKKAEQYLDIYKRYMPVDNSRFLGSMVFYWGQKQELTPTWFSFFDENGARTEAVNTMKYIWTGKQPATHAPPVKFMLINDKGGRDNLLFKPGAEAWGKLYLYGNDTANLTYKWELQKEDWYKVNGLFNNQKATAVKNAIVANLGTSAKFKAPEKEGPYRLFVYAYNKQGYFATCNIPFYVVSNP
jgi:hypothetical protein